MTERWPTSSRLVMSRNVIAALLIGVSVVITGCSAKGQQTEVRRFTKLPSSCSELTKPVTREIQEYAGRLYSASVEFKDAGSKLVSAPPDTLGALCSVIYPDQTTTVQIPVGDPRIRRVLITFRLETGDKPVTAQKRYFETSGQGYDGKTSAGIGEESYSATRTKDGSADATTAFRISNFYAQVSTSGENAPPQPGPGITDSPQLRSNLQSGSQRIAKALADNVDTVLGGK